MVKFPKSHWPPPEPPEFAPDGWISLFEAYKQVGRDLFPNEWLDGQELAVPSDEEIAARKAAAGRQEFQEAEKQRRIEKAKRASVGVVSGASSRRIPASRPRQPTARRQGPPFPAELVQLINDEETRKAARERGDQTWLRLRQWLFAGSVPAICIDGLGQLYEINNGAWASPSATATLLTGRVGMNGRGSYVLVSHADLEKALGGGDENLTAMVDDDAANSIAYTPPFLDFMIRASQEMGLDANFKLPKENIESWLRENWHEGLGQISDRKIEQMATFIRQPEDQKGGYFKPRRDD